MAYATNGRETAADTRERALDIGAAMIREGGLAQIKARVLAVRLNVSVGTIYNLFGDMDEFIYRLNARAFDGLQMTGEKAIEESRARQEGPRGQMLALSRAYLDFVSEHPEEWAAVVAFMRRSASLAPDWYREKERALRGLVESTIEGAPSGPDQLSVSTLARAMWGAVHGIVTVSLRRNGLGQYKEDVWHQIEFVVTAIAEKLESPTA